MITIVRTDAGERADVDKEVTRRAAQLRVSEGKNTLPSRGNWINFKGAA